jgi:hypothetical protein
VISTISLQPQKKPPQHRMDTILALKALIMGIVEGLTEFLFPPPAT